MAEKDCFWPDVWWYWRYTFLFSRVFGLPISSLTKKRKVSNLKIDSYDSSISFFEYEDFQVSIVSVFIITLESRCVSDKQILSSLWTIIYTLNRQFGKMVSRYTIQVPGANWERLVRILSSPCFNFYIVRTAIWQSKCENVIPWKIQKRKPMPLPVL